MKPKKIAGKSAWQYWSDLRRNSKKPVRANYIKPRSKGVKKKAAHSRGRKKRIPGLKEWYNNKIETCTWICEETGENCYSSDYGYQLSCQAHILPKEYFISVATHEMNHMCLSATNGSHKKYDKTWASARRMKVWPKANKIILEVLIPLLTNEEYRRLPDFIKHEYENPDRSTGGGD